MEMEMEMDVCIAYTLHTVDSTDIDDMFSWAELKQPTTR